jgi:predicted ribonuclease YlaK
MKTIITRAGAGSKVVCLGNLAQIDTPTCPRPAPG